MLDQLFSPRAIAVIGASPEPRRPGGHALIALKDYGFDGEVFPVNPRYVEINGMRCYPSVQDLPRLCDLALVAVPSADVPGVIEACGRAGIRFAIVFSAGFSEIGEAGAELQASLEAAIRTSGVRVVGPNCVGILNLGRRMFAGFGAGFRNPHWRGGPVAMISQSGGFSYSIAAFCQEQGIGMDCMVSTGNETDLTALDFIEYFLEQDPIRLVAVYLEGLKDGRRLRALGKRALEVGKPIAVWKVGNTESGRKAAVSHTANLTEDYDYYRDAFREGGFIELREVYDLIDAAKVFRSPRRPVGRRVAVVTTSGGAGVLISDRCEESGLELAELTPATKNELAQLVPSFASLANPVDLTAALAQIEPKFSQATELVVSDPNVDLVILRSYPGRDAQSWAANLVASAPALSKPVLISLSGTPKDAQTWASSLDEAGIACYEAPSRAVTAAAMLCRFSERERRLRTAIAPVRNVAQQVLSAQTEFDEIRAKQFLEGYGIRTPRRLFVPIQGELPARIELQFPIAVKIVSADIVHKTEVGGVQLGIEQAALSRTLRQMQAEVSGRAPHARLTGFLLEEMPQGVEMLVGALVNPAFGPLVVLGMGGTQAEIYRDVARRYAPFGVDEARDLLLSLRSARLLEGYRGAPPADIPALCELVSRVSWLIADHQNAISEIEMNPVLVGSLGRGVYAVDAVIRLAGEGHVASSSPGRRQE